MVDPAERLSAKEALQVRVFWCIDCVWMYVCGFACRFLIGTLLLLTPSHPSTHTTQHAWFEAEEAELAGHDLDKARKGIEKCVSIHIHIYDTCQDR